MRTHLHDPLPDVLADRYRVRDVLGRGGTAIVYLAEDIESTALVALKVMRPEVAATIPVQRFVQEIRVGSALHHPHILPVLDTGEVGGLPMLVTRYAAGGTLRQRLARHGAMPFDKVLAITREVAAALDHAHANGIAHRDIKPENILFDDDRAVVADFGIARAFAESGAKALTESGVVIGTPQYMSPEQAGSDRTLDGRSDIYSLGCVVFEMLGGEPPFGGASTKSILAKHMHEPPPRLSTMRPTATPAMDGVLNRALAKVPADRFQTAGAFAEALAGSKTGWSIRARRRALSASFAGVVAVMAALGVWRARTALPKARATPASAEDARRIAVLYFDDLTPDGHLRHVATGLTEDLIDRLSQIPALHVISPNGVRPFRDSAVLVDSLARKLDVGTLIAGNITGSGALLRVGIRVIDAANGRQLDGRSFERPAYDLLKLEDTLTTDIAFFLRQRLGQEVRLRTQRANATSTEAWELVQRAQELAQEASVFIRAGSPRAETLLLRADTMLTRAERLDPAWPEPTVDRARVTAMLAAVGESASRSHSSSRRNPSYDDAVAHAERALARHPRYAEALAARGEARLGLVIFAGAPEVDSLLRLAEIDLRAAAVERPDLARTWHQLSTVYNEQGRFTEAAAALQTAFETDAFLTEPEAVMNGLIFSSLGAGKFDMAGRWCQTARVRFAGDPRFMNCEVDLLGWSARDASAVGIAWKKVQEIEGSDTTGYAPQTWSFRRMMIAAIAARSGMRDSAIAIVARTEAERRDRPPALVAEAYVHVLLGDHKSAIERLAIFARSRTRGRAQIARSPWFAQLHSEPEFRALFPQGR